MKNIGSKQSDLSSNISNVAAGGSKVESAKTPTSLAGLKNVGKFGGGLFGKLKKKAVGSKKGKSNWFSKLKNKNINGGVMQEETLKIPLTHLGADYINFDLDENLEDEFLEDEDDNTYHRSESTNSFGSNREKHHQADKTDNGEDEFGDNFENKALLNKLNNDIKAGLIDTGSVNSQKWKVQS